MAKKKKKGIFSWLITITALAIFLYASYGLFDALTDYYHNRKMLGNLQDLYYDDNVQSGHTPTGSIRSGFESLLSQNEEVIGWIMIEDTQIDYPILQGDTNDTYLTCNFYGEESRAGSIFLDYRNDISSLGKNTILYGHRMKDGSMFQHLTKFLKEDFFETHRTFEFDTLYEKYEAEVFAVYETLTDFNYIQTDFDSDDEYKLFLFEILKRTKFSTNIELDEHDQIITLSTCDYRLDELDGRLVVHAKLTKMD